MTVLFADLFGSTPIGESLDPEELRAIYQRYFAALARQIRRYEGTIDKYVGDAIMAVFGAPVSHEDDAERSIRAGIGMQGAIAGLNDDLAKQHGVRLALRVGINTGRVVAGLLAGDVQQAYTVVGDTVNTAKRFEGIAPPGEVVVSDSTRALASRRFEFEALPPVSLKGKSEAIIPFRVVRERDEEIVPEVGRLVGRTPEMGILRAALADALEGRGQALNVSGEPGIGKSRLVLEFRRELDIDIQRLVARCASYERNTPYALVADLLRGTFGIHASDGEPVARERIVEGLRRYGVAGGEGMVTLLLDVFGFGERSVLGPELKRQSLVGTMRELLVRSTAERPLVVVIEDTQWMDNTSAEVLGELTPDLGRLRCLIITTSRPGGAPSWRAGHIDVGPLAEEEARALIDDLAGEHELPAGLADRVLDRTRFNPFFIEEVLRHARSSKDAEVPATVQETVEARLDRLPPGPRRLIETAAVIGRSFSDRLLRELLTGDPVAESVSILEQESFIVRYALRPELLYAFRQPILQEVAYEVQLLTTRRAAHGRVGAAIEALNAERPDEVTDVLAYHYERSDDRAKARTWLGRAGDRARSLYANDEALTSYRAALERATDDADSATILERIGDVQTLVGRYEDALVSYAAARARTKAGDGSTLARLLRKSGSAQRWQGDYASALVTLSEAAATLGASGDPESARIALEIGMTDFHRGDYLAAKPMLAQGVELGQRLGADDVLAEGLKILGNVANNLGDLREAIDHYRRSLAIYERLDDKTGIADLHSNLGNMYRRMGRFDEALTEHRVSLALRERIGHSWGVGTSHNNIGEVLRSMGRPDEAVLSLERALETWQAIGATAAAGLARMNLGAARVEAGDVDRGRAELRDALVHLEGTKFLPGAHRDLALAELAAGDIASAERHAQRALALARSVNARQTQAQVERVLAQIALAGGDRARARELLETSLRTFAELGEQAELARTEAVLATVNGLGTEADR